jgi:hypothetical protein
MSKQCKRRLQSGNEVPSEVELIRRILLHSREDEPLQELENFYSSQGDPRAELVQIGRNWIKTGGKKALMMLQKKVMWPHIELLKRIMPPPYGVNDQWGANCQPRLTPEEGAVTVAQLDEVERAIGLYLPFDYRASMLNYGGSCPNPADFKIPNTADHAVCYVTVKKIFGVTESDSVTDEFAEN